MRNKFLYRLIMLSCMLASTTLTAKETNHTFLAVRPQNMNLVLEQPLWDHPTTDKTTFGGTLQVTGFYGHSTNGSEIAKYFMFGDRDNLRFRHEDGGLGAIAAGAQILALMPEYDVECFNFNLRKRYAGVMHLSPEQETYGAHLSYHHRLDNWFKGLYLHVVAPVVHVANKPNFKEESIFEDPRGVTNGNGQIGHAGPDTLEKAFAGAIFSSDWLSSFRYAKLNGTQKLTGLADVDFRFGYNAFENKWLQAGFDLAVTFPTTNPAKAKYMFEPTLGNRGHWAMGAGAHLLLNGWKCPVSGNKIDAALHANYRYHFKDTEMRTLELKEHNWARYIRVRRIDPVENDRVLGDSPPGPNALTRPLDITPGSHVEGLASLTYHYGNWSFSTGYNLWWRQKEEAKLKYAWNHAVGEFGFSANNGSFNPALPRTPNLNVLIDKDAAVAAAKLGARIGVLRGLYNDGQVQATAGAAGQALRNLINGVAQLNNPIPNTGNATADIQADFANGSLDALSTALTDRFDNATLNGDPASRISVANTLSGDGAGGIGSAAVNNPQGAELAANAAIGIGAGQASNLINSIGQHVAEGVEHLLNNPPQFATIGPEVTIDQSLLAAPTNRSISSASTIHEYQPADGEKITEEQLDWDKVKQPANLTHKIFGTVGYTFNTAHPTQIGVGGSYEFGDQRTALNQWMLWTKLSVSF